MKKVIISLYKISNKLLLKAVLVIMVLLFTAFSNVSEELFKKVQQKLAFYTTNYSQEKVYVHFDKSYYTSGEDIWFKTYLVDSYTLRLDAVSKIVYVDLINPKNEILVSRTISSC